MIQGREKKYSELTGFSKDITPTRLKTLRSNPHKGDWRGDRMIRISYRDANITWKNTENEEFLIKTPYPVCSVEKKSIFLLLMFHLFLQFLKKVVKKGRMLFFLKKEGKLESGGWIKKGGVKTRYPLYL